MLTEADPRQTDAQGSDSRWIPIGPGQERVPLGEGVLLKNENTGTVMAGYFEWSDKAPFPYCISMDPTGIGRCKMTHWRRYPSAA